MVRTIIEDKIDQADCGLYFTRNIVGDTMETIFDGEYITVDICYGWAYFEVFGLDEDEEEALTEFYDGLCRKLHGK